MTTICYTPFKVPRVRFTKLDSCGRVVTGSCSQVVSDGIISVQITKTLEDRQEFFIKNGDGNFCVRETNAPILKFLSLKITLCGVNPDIISIAAAEPLVTSDDTAATKTGWSTEEGSAANVNFAFEAWTRITGGAGPICTGGLEYGYSLFPWCVESTIGDMTFENGAVNFELNCRTRSGSLWGVGPYNVDLSDANATLNNPIPLLTAIQPLQHNRMFLSRLAPPASSCGCAAV